MVTAQIEVLDNPIWNALNGSHEKFADGNDVLKRYRPDILPFMGFVENAPVPLNGAPDIVCMHEDVLILGELPAIPGGLKVVARLPCLQMVCAGRLSVVARQDYEVVLLLPDDAAEMCTFINMVQPGYFRDGTPLLGDYYGIRKDGELIAITGERFRLDGYTEISAVCTHPDHAGKGLAQHLINYVCNKIFENGTVPFLHVSAANSRAISLYELMGFKTRRAIDCWTIRIGN